jgi:hypothetical protein
MRLRRWAMLAFLGGQLAGCAQTPTNGNYCDLARPLWIGSTQTIDSLMQTDRDLLVGIVIHNETWADTCQ